MNYKVCILTAGVGSRMGRTSQYINKALLPIKQKPVLSHIIEKFPEDVEVVIAVGHQKETITDYLSLAYPKRKFTFVEVEKYMGPGTGPGYSMLQCKEYLQCPFIFFTADTIVLEEIPQPDHNWLGISAVEETEPYITVRIKDNLVHQLDIKTKNFNTLAFIGLAGVNDYGTFFNALEKDTTLIGGEIQVSNGFNSLIEGRLAPVEFTWFDTGTLQKYHETNKYFSKDEGFDFSKEGEFIYFVNERVIKFFSDKKITHDRYERSIKYLNGLCPPIEGCKGNFYSYKKINGDTLYNFLEPNTVADFLQWAQINLWKKPQSQNENNSGFKKICKEFYFDKTAGRVKQFYQKTGIIDCKDVINGTPTPTLQSLLKMVDWDYIADGIASNFHGDLQFDNILVTNDRANRGGKFVLLDWRQNFGGAVDVGDLYYDLAKLYTSTVLSYPLIKQGMFSFHVNGQSQCVQYNFHLKSDMLDAKEEYELFIAKNNYDLKKIKIIVALIFLNMSPMFNTPFDQMLYYLGKSSLRQVLSVPATAVAGKKPNGRT